MDPNAGVRRQAMGQLERRAAADLPTMPRIPRGNQFAEAGEMALEGTGLPSVRRGAETLTGVARNPSQPNAPMRALGGLGELGLGVASAATIGEFGGVRPRGRVPMREAPPRVPPPRRAFDDPNTFTGRIWNRILDDISVADDTRAYRPEARTPRPPTPAPPAVREFSDDEFTRMASEAQRALQRGQLDDYLNDLGNVHPDITEELRYRAWSGNVTGSGPGRQASNEIASALNRRIDELTPPPSDPEALSLARSWIDSFGGGPSAEARAIEVMTEHMQEARNPAWRQRLADAIDSVGSRAYVQGERTSFSQRVEDAWPDIYGGAAAPDPSPPLTRPPTQIAPNGMPIRPPQPFRNSLRGGNDDLAEAASFGRAPDVGNAGGPFTVGMTRPAPNVTQTTGLREHGILWQEFGDFRSVNHTNLATPDQGKGFGSEMYRRSVDEALAQGRIFASDSNVSDAANGVYRRLERDGFTVVRGSQKDSPSLFVLPPGSRASYEELAARWNRQIDAASVEEARLSAPNAPARGDGQASRAPGIAPQQAPPRTSPRLFPSPNMPRPRLQAPAGTGDMQPRGVFGVTQFPSRPGILPNGETLAQFSERLKKIGYSEDDIETALQQLGYAEAPNIAQSLSDNAQAVARLRQAQRGDLRLVPRDDK